MTTDPEGPSAAYRQAPLPPDGGWRVHPDPASLPRLRHEGPGGNRYDDPDGQYTVRYLAKRLTGSLLETMARFRPAPTAEALLDDITNIGDPADQPEEQDHPDRQQAVRDWLARQHVARIALRPPPPPVLDVHDPQLLLRMDKHPQVRQALDASPLGTPTTPTHLDEGVIRISGPIGRPITRALSRAVYEWLPDAAGLAYQSRLDDAELCWALWDHIPVDILTVGALTPAEPIHLHAVRASAALLEIDLPEPWA